MFHGVCGTIAGVVLAATLPANPVFAQDRQPAPDRASSSRTKGEEGALLFVYEFSDFECTHCARFATEVFPRIDSAFVRSGKVRWVFVNLPVPTHENAWIAHEAAVCAGAVGDKFWAMHDKLFSAQKEWTTAADPGAALSRYARELGVPMEAFTACTATDRVAPLLLQDVIFAASSRVNGTPAFIINNEQTVMGLKSFEEWKTLLDQMLKGRTRRD
jgi:protein-disulfide isomerase